MSESAYERYWNQKVPMEGVTHSQRFPDPYVRLNTNWLRLQRAVFVTLPTQLDRTRSWRNRFLAAVR